MTKYTPTDILNFLNDILKDDPNLVRVTMNAPNAPLQMEASTDPGTTPEIVALSSITLEFKDVNKANCFRSVHDFLKDYLKDNDQSFNLISGSGNTLLVLLL